MRFLVVCLTAATLTTVGALPACTTFEEDLNRSERAFEQNEHERALAILRQLESDQGRLSITDRARYCYLRGMTDYRIGYRIEARHWLSLAAAVEGATPGSLPADSVKRMNESLKEMNESVYSGGIDALSNDATKGKAHDDDEESARDSKESETTPDKGDSTDAPPKKKKPAKASDDN
jgi:hypothetical protein